MERRRLCGERADRRRPDNAVEIAREADGKMRSPEEVGKLRRSSMLARVAARKVNRKVSYQFRRYTES